MDYNPDYGVLIFDLTMGEVQQAAADGCGLCCCILSQNPEFSESTFLAAEWMAHTQTLKFGTPEPRKWTPTDSGGGRHDERTDVRFRRFSRNCEFTMFSVAGKHEKAVRILLNVFQRRLHFAQHFRLLNTSNIHGHSRRDRSVYKTN